MSGKFLTIALAFLPAVATQAADKAAPKVHPKAAQQVAGKVAPNTPPKVARDQTQAARLQAQATRQALNSPNLPGGLTLQRLAQMAPEERAAALGTLPPARQQQIEQKLEAYRNLAPEAQTRLLNKQERLAALPPERRAQVRQSLNEFPNMPVPRRIVIFQELARQAAMTEDQRAAYIAKPGYLRRFSPAEMRIIDDLQGIVP